MNEIKHTITNLIRYIQTNPHRALMTALPYVLFLVAVVLVWQLVGHIHEISKNRKLEKNGILLEVLVKRTVTSKATEELIRNIHSLLLNTNLREFMRGRPYMSYEIVATQNKIMFYFWVPRGYKDVLMERIYATYPECAIREAAEDPLPDRVWVTVKDYIQYFKAKKAGQDAQWPKNHLEIHGTEIDLAYHHVLSLNKRLEKEDILSSLIAGMKNLEWHDRVVVQVLARPVNGSWQNRGRKILEKYVSSGKRPMKDGQFSFSFQALADEFSEELGKEIEEMGIWSPLKPSTKKTPYDRKEISGATDKILDAGFETTIRLATISHYDQGAKTRLKILGAAFSELDKENKTRRRIVLNPRLFYRRVKKRRVYLVDQQNILTPGELSKFFMRLPGEELIDNNPEIQALVVKEFAPPMNVETEKMLIGMNSYRGKDTPIGIKYEDLKRHIIVQGGTGTGKSEWAKGLMKQLMEDGLGMALFEPHGKMATEVLMDVPEKRRKDVIIFDLLDDYPPPFNFCKIKKIKGQKEEYITEKLATEIIEVNKRKFAEAWSGKNAYYLENAIKTVIELRSGNYVDIRRLFSDSEYREYAVKNLKDPQLKHFWKTEFKENTRGEISQGTQSTVNSVDYKLGSFLNSKSLLRAVGQDDCIDFKEIMDQNKIIIFRFDKERMSEDQIYFIGSMAIKLFTVEGFRRDKSVWDKPFTIFVDEAQNFIDPTIETILSELRKKGIPLVLMHQFLEQMNKVKGLVDAIYGNVGTRITFTCGEPDAPFFEKVFAPRIDQSDLVRIPSRYGYIKMQVDGQKSETFNIRTLDNEKVDPVEGKKCYDFILEQNRRGRLHYKEIDKMISKRIAGSIDESEDEYYEEMGSFSEEQGDGSEITWTYNYPEEQEKQEEEFEYPFGTDDLNVSEPEEIELEDKEEPMEPEQPVKQFEKPVEKRKVKIADLMQPHEKAITESKKEVAASKDNPKPELVNEKTPEAAPEQPQVKKKPGRPITRDPAKAKPQKETPKSPWDDLE